MIKLINHIKKYLSLMLVYFGLLSPVNAQIDVAGAIPGAFEVGSTGNANYSIKIAVPPGINGMVPELSLDYSSNSANDLVGVGWSLSGLSQIGRCEATKEIDGFNGGVTIDSNDRYCIGGQRLIAVNGVDGADGTEYRTEIDTFSRIKSYGTQGTGPAYFVIETKSGQTIYYGYAPNYLNTSQSSIDEGRIEAWQMPSADTVVYWAISQISDKSGNYLSFSYFEDRNSREYRPTQIDYTGNTNTGRIPGSSVVFEYEDRWDTLTNYYGGSLVRTTKRIKGIKTFTGISMVRDYQLGYQYSPSVNQSRLISIKECGVDECYPATTFGWSDINNGFASRSLGVTNNWTSGYTWTGDFDGDGKSDVASRAGDSVYIRLSNGNGFSERSWLAGSAWGTSGYTWSGDFNGDGRTDIASYDGSSIRMHLSRGTGFANGSWGAGGTWGPSEYTWTGDFNGDGRTDIASRNGSTVQMRLSQGGTFQSTGWLASSWGPSEYTWTGDFNGDGLTDIASRNGSTIYMYISLGNGFQQRQTGVSTSWGTSDLTWTGDFNGDGMTDIASAVGGTVYVHLSNGVVFQSNSWSASSNWGLSGYSWTGDFNGDGMSDIASRDGSTVYVRLSKGNNFTSLSWSAFNWGTIAEFNWAGDFNGDGKTDLASANGSQIYRYDTQATVPNLLTSITNGLGVQLTIAYTPITDSLIYTKDSIEAVYPEMDFQGPMYVVSETNVSNGIGGLNRVTYTYNGARLHMTGRGFLGFNWVKSIDRGSNTGITKQTFFKRQFPYIGFIDHEEVRLSDTSTVILSTSAYQWAQRTTGRVYFPYLLSKVDTTNELDGTQVTRVTTTYLDNLVDDTHPYDLYGNPEKIEVVASDGHKTTSVNGYNNDTTNWLLGLLTSTVITKTLPDNTSKTRETAYAYYASTGLLLSETIEPNNSNLWLKHTYQYDAFGNRQDVTTTGPGITARNSYTNYGTDGLFPVTLTNAKGHIEQRVYNPGTGAILLMTGPNSLTTSWSYDSLGRLAREIRADGTETIWTYGSGNASNCSTTSTYSTYYVKTTVSGAAPITVYYDQLGRQVQQCTIGLNSALIYSDTNYNHLSQVARSTRNYFSGMPVYGTNYTYDDIGRVLTEVSDGITGQVSNTYNGLITSVTDRLSNVTTRKVNEIGQLIKVTDTLNNFTLYDYDPLGNLTWVQDAAGNITTMGYDIRGNKIWMNDPDMGYWQYQYNTLGELTSQQDAKSQIATMSYDVLGRMTQSVEAEGTSIWEYDTATKGIGKLYKVSRANDGYQQVYSYDSSGRTQNVTTRILSVDYAMSTSYDPLGRVSTITYPTGFSVRNVYDSATGILAAVQKADGTINYWRINGINADGQVTWDTLGNNIETVRGYSPATGRLDSIISGNAGTVQYLQYTYDSIGNLTQRRDLNQSLTENFTYDELNRLKSAALVGYGTKTYQYDAIGNIIFKSDVGTYQYNSTRPHAVANVLPPGTSQPYTPADVSAVIQNILNTTYTTGHDCDQNSVNNILDALCMNKYMAVNQYQYDANGNMVSGGGRTILYTSFNIPRSITKGSKFTNFQYAPDHTRIVQTSNEGTTIYINPGIDAGVHYEKTIINSVTTHKHYIYGGVGVVAVYNERSNGANDTRYMHKDHLGSIDVITNESGNVVERLSYEVFGKRRMSNWQDSTGFITSAVTHHGFTGHEHLDEVGLIHMNGRVYDPSLGRFLSADPIVKYVASTQGFNRYSYTDNNPLSRIDPSGYGWGDVKRGIGQFWNDTKDRGSNFLGRVGSGLARGWKSIKRSANEIWQAAKQFGEKHGKEVLIIAAAVYTGGATLAATSSYAAAGAATGAVIGAGYGYEKTGTLSGAIRGAVGGAIIGYTLGSMYQGYLDWRYGKGQLYKVNGMIDGTPNLTPVDHVARGDTLFVNGAWNNAETAALRGVEQLGTDSFTLFHNPSSGLISDLTEAALSKLTGGSSLSTQLAGIIKREGVMNIAAHSQGAIIVVDSLNYLAGHGFQINGLSVTINGGAISKYAATSAINSVGGHLAGYNAHFFDPVPNIAGFNTLNPFRIAGSFLSIPALFMGPNISPHTVYAP